MTRNEYNEIIFEDFKRAIEYADTIEDVASLREILEEDFVENTLECSTLLSFKESLYEL